MGSYASTLNDTNNILYIKYAANSVGLGIAAVVSGLLGVVALVVLLVTGGLIAVALVPAAASLTLGTTGITLTLSGVAQVFLPLCVWSADHLGAMDLATRDAGYRAVAPGNSYKSSKLSLSLVHQADVKMVQKVNDNTITMWSGSFTVFSGATANSVKTYKMSQQLGKLEMKQFMFTDASDQTPLAGLPSPDSLPTFRWCSFPDQSSVRWTWDCTRHVPHQSWRIWIDDTFSVGTAAQVSLTV